MRDRTRGPEVPTAQGYSRPVTSSPTAAENAHRVLTLSCPDRPGIVRAVAGLLADHGGNITESQQFGDPDSGLFFMRVQVEGRATADELSAALGIGSFAEKTLVAAGQCTKIDEESDAAAVGLLGCGIMAGIGAAINTGEIQRGESVAVIGCGGVGTAAIAGAQLAGATTIIAVDIDDAKLEQAKRFGATHAVNSREQDPVETIRELTDGHGADVVIDAVGRPETYKQAFYARDLAGRVVLVGVPTPEMLLELPLLDVFGRGGSLKSSWYGDCLPSRDFQMLIDQYRLGRLDLDGFVTERVALGDVQAAFDKMSGGNILRSVVVL